MSIVIVLAMVNQTLVYLLGSFYLLDRLVFPYVFGPFWKWQYSVKLSSTQVTACLQRIKCPNIHDNYLPNWETFQCLIPYFLILSDEENIRNIGYTPVRGTYKFEVLSKLITKYLWIWNNCDCIAGVWYNKKNKNANKTMPEITNIATMQHPVN